MLELIIEGDGTEKLEFEVRKILNSGRTARDPSQIQKHLDELEKAGIASPLKGIPIFFPKLPDRITTSDRIEVLPDSKTSGEVEYVLLLDGDNIYVSVGSDHSDRELEKSNILAAKHMCRNVIAPKVWRYDDVKEHWDDLIMRAWVEKDGQRQLYQEGKLATMLRPEELIEKVKLHVIGDLQGMVIYGGTFPLISGEFCFSPRFEAELIDEHTGRTITCAYSEEPITWFK